MELGLIEGFYGRAWSWPQRASVVTALAAHGYGTHLYAPKADVTLRANWRQPLPADWLQKIEAHQSVCAACGVQFGLGLSPEGFNPGSASDWQQFEALITELNGLKLHALALLFDDPADRNPLSAQTQARLVQCGAAATNAAQLFVCPTWYSNDPVLERIYGPPPIDYLRQLGSEVDPSIQIFWAGEQICATEFKSQELEKIAEMLGRLPTLWDNYPVNDGPQMFGHLHLREPQHRPVDVLTSRINAHFVNPALQPTLTQIPAVALSTAYQSFSNGGESVSENERFFRAARTCASDTLSRQIWRDLPVLQDAGLETLGATKSELVKRYSEFPEPAAQEIVLWLNGHWNQTDLKIDTQPDA